MTAAPAEGVPQLPDLASQSRRSPTVLRLLLGTQLRRLRESKHIRLEEAGHAIRASHSKISRMELGRVGFRRRDVADLLTLYGVSDEAEREALLSLVAQANAPGWWHKYDDVLPSWFEAYVGLEQAASTIRCYEVQFVPGLLQTPEYAAAVVRLGHPDAPAEEIERRVRLRMDRQELLARPDAPNLWAVIDEAVLRRPVGGPEVMRAQIEHLLEMVNLPRVTLQVIPFSAGGHAAAGGPFSILRFAGVGLPDVVYLEQLTSAIYLEKREDIDRYLAVMERLCIQARPFADTKRMLSLLLTEL
ncbi:XRE family transcriptional regulator [Microbispora triticiradicis]|uniref:Helix-turn-helix domain-containing protein n=2 Tax=Microbispora triticiradicis TaxID=2200763 RepID=A0A5R8ZL86_9ACTN|nr:XRE family transcriptional regulator [Microbispora triticiradicis]TLP66563.1 helix-turn-helix domain-containing protein [Microbispora fusca]GLW25467.1 transcriptional regulator [Microbispora amethystogenes]